MYQVGDIPPSSNPMCAQGFNDLLMALTNNDQNMAGQALTMMTMECNGPQINSVVLSFDL